MIANRSQTLQRPSSQSREEVVSQMTGMRWVRKAIVTPAASLSQKIKECHRCISARRAIKVKNDVVQEKAEHLQDYLHHRRRQEKTEVVRMVQMQEVRRNQIRRCGRCCQGLWTQTLRFSQMSSKKLLRRLALSIQALSRSHAAAGSMANSLALTKIWVRGSSKWAQTS